MSAIPPQLPALEDTTYTPEQPVFVQLAADSLGAAATPDDGFDDIFDPAANGFPGGDVIINELDGLTADFTASTDAVAQPLDPSFEGDVAVSSLQGENLIGDLGQQGIDIQAQTLPDFPALSNIDIGAIAPGFISGDTNVAERAIAGTTIGVRADGLVAWYIDSREAEPIYVNISVDGSDWALFGSGRGGNQMLGFDPTGHFIAIQWQNARGILAQAYIDDRGETGDTQVIVPPATAIAGEITGGVVTLTAPPNAIPPVPAGLVPSGKLTVTNSGEVIWSTTNVKAANVVYTVDGGPEIFFSGSNSGDVTHFIMSLGHVYVWRLRDVSQGGTGAILAQQQITEAAAAPPLPATPQAPPVITQYATPAGIIQGTAQQALAVVTPPAGVTWQPRQTNTVAGPVTIYVPIDASGNNISGVYGTITPAL